MIALNTKCKHPPKEHNIHIVQKLKKQVQKCVEFCDFSLLPTRKPDRLPGLCCQRGFDFMAGSSFIELLHCHHDGYRQWPSQLQLH